MALTLVLGSFASCSKTSSLPNEKSKSAGAAGKLSEKDLLTPRTDMKGMHERFIHRGGEKICYAFPAEWQEDRHGMELRDHTMEGNDSAGILVFSPEGEGKSLEEDKMLLADWIRKEVLEDLKGWKDSPKFLRWQADTLKVTEEKKIGEKDLYILPFQGSMGDGSGEAVLYGYYIELKGRPLLLMAYADSAGNPKWEQVKKVADIMEKSVYLSPKEAS